MTGQDILSVRGWIRDNLAPSDAYLHRIDRTIADIQTPFQRVRIIESGTYGLKLFLDDVLQSATGDEFIYHESLVHPAMLAAAHANNPRNVLILGGGEGATLREVARWRTVERIVMVDIDRAAVEACRRHLPEMHQGAFDDPRLELVYADAAKYVRRSHEKWDVVISDITEPVESGPSNFCYTQEYFSSLSRLVPDQGIVVTQSGPVTPTHISMHARITHTLASVFAHVHSYAASVPTYAQAWGFTLASKTPLLPRLAAQSSTDWLQSPELAELRFLDRVSLDGILRTPVYVRAAIEQERRIYTDSDLPANVVGADINARGVLEPSA